MKLGSAFRKVKRGFGTGVRYVSKEIRTVVKPKRVRR
jgi:hypothetical protein